MGKINQAWYLAQPRYSRKGHGVSSKQSARFCNLPMGSLTLCGEWMEGEGGWWTEWEEGREWQLGLVCKMRKDRFLKK